MRSFFDLIAVLLASFFISACTGKKTTLFEKMESGETGIDFVNVNHETERSNILTYEYFYNGGGVALGDINNDGLVDIYFTSNSFSNKLYLNLGNFKFKDITDESGTSCDKGWKTGVSMVDINADGLLDIYVCRSASPNETLRKNILLINNGNLTFTDRAKEFNLDDPSFSTQAAFFDFDRDGDLDCFLLNHSLLEFSNAFDIRARNTVQRFPHVGNKLLRNDGGHFKDVSDSLGIYGPSSNYGLGVSVADVNDDGWLDIYAGCDYTGRDHLLLNREGKQFADVTEKQLSHISKFTMGSDIADVNGDGQLDIFTLDMLPEDNFRQKQLMGADKYDVFRVMTESGLHAQYMRNMLHLNNGDSTFTEAGQLLGVSNTDWSWSALINDFNNDGFTDIFVSNGFKRDLTDNDFAKFKAQQEIQLARQSGRNTSMLDVIAKFKENKIPNYAFEGSAQHAFRNENISWGLDEPLVTNGAAYGDLDNDGDLDLVLNNMNDEAGIYRNSGEASRRHFISVQLESPGKNRRAVGSRVTVYAGQKIFVKELLPVRGFQSSVDYTLTFGLGDVDNIDSVIVRWPDATYGIHRNPPVDQSLRLHEKSLPTYKKGKSDHKWFSESSSIPFQHVENNFNDFNTQALLPRMYSTLGPALATADIDGNNVPDVFIGGAKGQESRIYKRVVNGYSDALMASTFDQTVQSEIVDAVFFDMDGDRDNDLYVVTGGYEFNKLDEALKDFLFENTGRGAFKSRTLPDVRESGSCVRPADVDSDGDIDLFVGSRLIPGRYPETPKSYFLMNDGNGNFSVDEKRSGALDSIGMVTDALWIDLNADKRHDLIVVGEWMPVAFYINDGDTFVDRTTDYLPQPSKGFWNCINSADFDGDGDIDFVAGNLGLNHQMRTSPTSPAVMYFDDFDQNGSVDPILAYQIGSGLYPYASRDEIVEQLPSFKKRFTNYADYSRAAITDVLGAEEIRHARRLEANCLQTSYFENKNGHFEMRSLPIEFQAAPVFAMEIMDVNADGLPDILCGGNLTATRARSGKLTGNCGLIGFGNGKGEFTTAPLREIGLKLTGDVRRLRWVNRELVAAMNDDAIKTFRLNGRSK